MRAPLPRMYYLFYFQYIKGYCVRYMCKLNSIYVQSGAAPICKRHSDSTVLLNRKAANALYAEISNEMSVGVNREWRVKAGGFVELMSTSIVDRQWSCEATGRMVAEMPLPGVTVNEVARRCGVKVDHLLSRQTLTR